MPPHEKCECKHAAASFSTCGVSYDTSCLKGVARTLTSRSCGLALANIDQNTEAVSYTHLTLPTICSV
eukprot:9035570-Alexandrium_andersonii.AAC.1